MYKIGLEKLKKKFFLENFEKNFFFFFKVGWQLLKTLVFIIFHNFYYKIGLKTEFSVKNSEFRG